MDLPELRSRLARGEGLHDEKLIFRAALGDLDTPAFERFLQAAYGLGRCSQTASSRSWLGLFCPRGRGQGAD